MTTAAGCAVGAYSPHWWVSRWAPRSCRAPRTSRPTAFARLPGAQLRVLGAWSGSEQTQFEAVLHGFTERTGASVTYISAEHSVPAALDARFAAGDPPDVALLPQPGLLRHYAAAQRLVPLDSATSAVVRRDYSPIWQSLASADGTLYGVWFKAANKSLLWYDVGAFERAGMAPPDELSGLLAVPRRPPGERRDPVLGRRAGTSGRSRTGSRISTCSWPGRMTTTCSRRTI